MKAFDTKALQLDPDFVILLRTLFESRGLAAQMGEYFAGEM